MIKKRIIILLFSITFVFNVFSEERLFNKRIFDFTIDVPVNVSNNMINAKDIFQPTLLIDFTKIANNLDEDGFSVIVNSKPRISFGVDFPHGLILKFNSGLDLYTSLSIGKGLFNFLGIGNNLNENLVIDLKGNGDIFAYLGIDLGLNTKKLSFTISPSLYFCLLHASSDGSNITITNSNEGDFGYSLNGSFFIYSDILQQFSLAELKESLFNINYMDIFKNAGFDLGLSFSYNLYRYLTVYGNATIPIYPSKITKRFACSVDSAMTTSLSQISSGEFTAPSFNFNKGSIEDAEIKVNRPMKFSLSGKFHPFNGLMDYTAGFGIGFEHPFAQDGLKTECYFDYLVGFRFGFWNILNFICSTERTDKIYMHKLQMNFNVRVLDLTVGVSAESSDFVNSFKLAGLGAFFKLSVGF